MLLEELFFQVGVTLVIAALVSLVVFRLRQPLIIAYILTGIIAGPGLLSLVQSTEVFEVMSQIGMAFLLFTVGMELNWRSVKDVGGIAFAVGMGQIIFTTIIGFVVAQALGFEVVTSLYLAIAFTFSSTIIIVKLLMDKDELDTLYGRISLGLLLVQDFVAIFILLGLGALEGGASASEIVMQTIFKAAFVIPVLWVLSTWVVPPLVRYAAKSQELLFVFTVAWCFFIAGLLYYLGFGIEIGALLAGITLSGTVFEREMNTRIRPIRDFFLILFFIFLGTHLVFNHLGELILPIIVFSLFILLIKPLVVMLVLRSLGYHPRTGFLSGTTVAQISEFSHFVIAAGVVVGHVSQDLLGLTTSIAVITIALSSYAIKFNEQLYERFSWLFKWLEPKHIHPDLPKNRPAPRIMMFGLHRVGVPILHSIRRMRSSYVVVDFDPQVIRELSEIGEPAMYGDAGDENFLREVGAAKARCIISTIPDLTISMTILGFLKEHKFDGVAIVCARTTAEANKCYKAGATYVIIPSVLGGEKFKELLEEKKMRRKSWETFASREREELARMLSRATKEAV